MPLNIRDIRVSSTMPNPGQGQGSPCLGAYCIGRPRPSLKLPLSTNRPRTRRKRRASSSSTSSSSSSASSASSGAEEEEEEAEQEGEDESASSTASSVPSLVRTSRNVAQVSQAEMGVFIKILHNTHSYFPYLKVMYGKIDVQTTVLQEPWCKDYLDQGTNLTKTFLFEVFLLRNNYLKSDPK